MTLYSLVAIYVVIASSLLLGILIADLRDARKSRARYRRMTNLSTYLKIKSDMDHPQVVAKLSELPFPLRAYAESSSDRTDIEELIQGLWKGYRKLFTRGENA